MDDIQIQQVMVNLVKNALDAIAETGRSDGQIDIQVGIDDTWAQVTVTDNGPGVPAEARRKLFDSFLTTKPKGVGLGLSICKSIASAHGGTLRHEQPAAGGSRFVLSLPLQHIG